MIFFEHFLLFTLALGSNILSAIVGGGAGLLQLPALLLLGLPFSMALATHKIATVALGLGASIKHLRHGTMHWQFIVIMLAFGLPGVFIGALLIVDVPEIVAKRTLGVLTIGLGMYSFFKKTLGQTYHPKNRTRAGYVIGGMGLLCLGVVNGSLTSGTGLFVTLWLVTWFGLDYKRATTYTMVLVGLFWNATGAVTLASQAPVKWGWLPPLLLGSVIGGYIGAQLALSYGNKLIKRTFEVVTILMGLSLLLN